MGHLYTGLCDTRMLARTMLEDWEIESAVEENDTGKTIPNHHLRRNIERFSTPHTARDPSKVEEVEFESEELEGMTRQPLKVGAIRFHHEPKSINTSHAGVTATTFQGTTSVMTSRGPHQLEGARWHLLIKVFSNPKSFGADLHSELLLQKRLLENPKHRSLSWQVLRKASKFFGANPYIGETGLATPSFFLNARRGAKITWGVLDDSPVIVNWSGWTHGSKLRSLRPWKLRTTGIYSHIPWARRSPPLLWSRLAPRESSIPKGKPAGREGDGRQERTNLPHTAWTPKCRSIKTARSPTPTSRHGSTSSDEIRKRSPGYAIWCGGIDLLGGYRVG